jgi:hypothetical protein
MPRDLAGSDARKASVWFLLSPSAVAVTVLNKCEISCSGSENVAVLSFYIFAINGTYKYAY